jgi:hypothetical protein
VCFSFEADLIAGVAISAAGVDALRHPERPGEVPLAVLPLTFGIHHLVEAVIWLEADGRVGSSLGGAATWVYLAFALVVLPWYVPVAVRAAEPDGARRGAMAAAGALGALVAGVLGVELVRGPVEAVAADLHIDYRIDLTWGAWVAAAYVLAVTLPLLASSRRLLRWYGIVNLPVVALVAWLDAEGFVSLWCAWAALSSVIVLVELRGTRRTRAAVAA